MDELKVQLQKSEDIVSEVIKDSVIDPLQEKSETIKNNLDALK
tara:strand:- start:251 stop:379 length:129 start_codon:yes stop_codon:yes gene_type:complete